MKTKDLNCEYLYLNFFGNVESIGPVYLNKILEEYGSAENAYLNISKDNVDFLPEKIMSDIKNLIKNFDAHSEYAKLEGENIKICRYLDPDYPYLLKQIYAPPPFFYYRGNISNLNSQLTLGVVGSRKQSSYGKMVLENFVPGLTKNNFAIISGLALGTDGYAHKTCLENNGYTVAVLGCGLDDETIYPQSNFYLAKKILDSGGALISEYPIKSPSIKFHFPVRNRLISGLSRGVLVVEAAEKSGSLITAVTALEQGRDVFAVPGSIFSETSHGTNTLINKGAICAQNFTDILKHYKIKESGTQQTLLLSVDENIVFELIKREKNTIQDIINTSGKTFGDVSLLLTLLIEKNVIKKVDDFRFAII